MKPSVVILGDSFNNTLGLIRSLGLAGAHISLVLIGTDRLHICKSKYLNDYVILPDYITVLDVLTKLGSHSCPPYLICTNDVAAEFIDANEAILSEYFITPMRGSSLKDSFKKDVQCNMAREYGLSIPESITFNTDTTNLPNFTYPILIKPIESTKGTKGDIHVCQNRQELEKSLSLESKCKSFIAQQFIEKEYELNFIGIITPEGNAIIPGAIKKIRHYPTLQSPCSFGKYIPSNELNADKDIQAMKRLMTYTGYHGPFSIEMLHSKGKNYFMEINFRHDGLAYTPTAAGINLFDCFISKTDHVKKIKSIYMMDLSIDYCHVKNGSISRLTWLRDFLKTKCMLNWNWRDPMPTLAYYGSKIKRKFRPGKH